MKKSEWACFKFKKDYNKFHYTFFLNRNNFSTFRSRMNISDFSPRGFLRTTDEVVNFIRLYKSYPCLWNVRSEEYKRIDLKNKAVQEIADMYQIPVELVKKKIHSLRCTYNKELKKMRDSKYKSNGDGPTYHTSLIWFNEMNFLQDIITPRKSWDCENIFHDLQDSQDAQDCTDWQDTQDFHDHDMKDTNHQFNGPTTTGNGQQERENVNVTTDDSQNIFGNLVPSTKPQPPTTTTSINGASTTHQFPRLIEKSRFFPYRRPILGPIPPSTEFDIFGASVAAQLRQMDLCIAIETMAELQGVLSRRRIQDINHKRYKASLEANKSPTTAAEPQSSTAVP